MSYNGPLLTRSYGPNFKGSKLSILEMDNNLLYLEQLAQTKVGANYAQTVGTQVTGVTSTGTIVSVEITTNGYPVQVTVTGDANPTGGSGNWCQLRLFRDGSPIGNIVQAESSADGENIPFTLNFIDSPVAGIYNYTLEVVDIAGEFQFGEVDGPVITTIELANRNWNQTVGTQVIVPEGNTAQLVAVSITTTGAPVQIMVTGDANPTSDSGWCRLQLYRDGNPIGNAVQAESSLVNENIPYALNFIDEVASGTYNYTLEATATAGSDFSFGEADGPVMTVVELVTAGGDSWSESDNSVVDSARSNSKGGEYNVICCSVNSTIIGGRSNEISASGYNTVYDSGIFGGDDNLICNSGQSVIIGGCENQICTDDDYNAIIAGCRNRICGFVGYSAIVGGACNMIYGDSDADYSAILGGCYNTNSYSEYGVILGGACNCLYNSDYSGILAGCCNIIQNNSCNSAILAGCYNCICNDSEVSAILAGCGNKIYGNSDGSTIVGGSSNCIEYSNCNSAIIAGRNSCIEYNSCNSIIMGGYDNYIRNNSCNSTILGSYDSCMCCNVKGSSIISGDDHCMRGGLSTFTLPISPYTQYCTTGFVCASSMLAGCDNRIESQVRNSVIIGGRDNGICGTVCQVDQSTSYYCITCDSAIVSSQDSCIINSQKSTIIGSCEARIFDSCHSQIIGSETGNYYSCNQILTSRSSSIISSCGTDGIFICDSNNSAIIAAGGGNTITSAICNSSKSVVIGANEGFICTSNQSFVLGGNDNELRNVSDSGIIGGMYQDIVNSCSSTIIGGRGNLIYGFSGSISSCNATIIGGSNNAICGSLHSSIIGGQLNSMTASNCSVIIGGSNFTLDSCNDVVMVPKLITGTFGSMAAWKLGATASTVGATVQTNQYIEVEVNGITYKLALIS